MKNIELNYSVNFDKIQRSFSEITYGIFHYTGMVYEKKAIKRLTSKNCSVRDHCFIKRNR